MAKDHQIETEYFRFSQEGVQILRSRFPYKTVTYNEIAKIHLIKGIRVKRPILVLIFGLLIIISSFYLMLFTSGFLESLFNYEAVTRSYYAFKGFGLFLLMGGFLLVFGSVAIYHAIIPTWVLRLELNDGSRNIMSLKELIKTNKVLKLVQLLETKLGKDQLEIDHRLA